MSLNYSNLPPWLEQNKVFRKLFILRKLFITRTRFKHYSQFAEDISIAKIFPRNYKGFFVDVGCFHPKKYNNTYKLYRRGWRGINIDIDSIKIEGFNIVRPGDININCAVGNDEGEKEYFSSGFYALTTSLDKEFTEGKQGYVKKMTACSKLDNIILKTRYKNQEIDFLSVDAEGYDLEVLKSLNFTKYDPKLIAVEIHHRLFKTVEKSELYKHLIALGYCLVGWCGLTLLMASKTLQEMLTHRNARLETKGKQLAEVR